MYRYDASTNRQGPEKLVIQKSDLFILVVATAGLAVGVARWHNNTQNVSAVTIPASSTVVIPAPEMPPEPTSVNAIATADQNTNQVVDAMTVDATLVVPTREIIAEVDNTLDDSDAVQLVEYVVQSGDYLSKIAVEYDTDVATLKRLNGLSTTTLQIGQVLKYPVNAPN